MRSAEGAGFDEIAPVQTVVDQQRPFFERAEEELLPALRGLRPVTVESAFGVEAWRVARPVRDAFPNSGRTKNDECRQDPRRVVLAVIFVGDGLLWVVAPRSRGLVWLGGPATVRRLVEGVTLERPWLARLIGVVQVAAGVWMARRAYREK